MTTQPNLLKASIDDIRRYVGSKEGQEEIQSFIESLHRDVGSPNSYFMICKIAEAGARSFESATILSIFERLERFIEVCPPGHDPFHILRDLLAGLALVNSDPFVAKAAFKGDIVASILGGTFHDIGNAVTHRYDDRRRKVGHAEIGAWLFYNTTMDLVPGGIGLLTAYAIAAHTHYLKPLKVQEPEGFERQPYWYGIEFVDGDKDKPYGFAPILTRFADRLDTNGVTHFCRHLLATADAIEAGGEDLTGDTFFEINREALLALFKPEVRRGKHTPPTTLEHIRNFALSNFGGGPYSRDDHLFPVMTELMWIKVSQTNRLIQVVTKEGVDMSDFSRKKAKSYAIFVLRNLSGSPHFDRSWDVLLEAWETLDNPAQGSWFKGFDYILRAYFEWLDTLAEFASANEEYSSLVKEIKQKLSFNRIHFH
jgi:hypothetical protein